MVNDFYVFDEFDWVNKSFVWLRFFNNLFNLILWTIWTFFFFYTFWLFFFTREMHFIEYYVFIYSMYLNVFAIWKLHAFLYQFDRDIRDAIRAVRIDKILEKEEKIEQEQELLRIEEITKKVLPSYTREAVIRRAKRIANIIRCYPRLKPLMHMNASVSILLFFIKLEEKNDAHLLRTQVQIKELEDAIRQFDQENDELLELCTKLHMN